MTASPACPTPLAAPAPRALRARWDADLGGCDWVFAYGSLIWDPGFEPVESRPARVDGWHRAFCIASVKWRGTPEAPGVVLGLDAGGHCDGVALRIAAHERERVLAGILEREMVLSVYRPLVVEARLAGSPVRRVQALAFVADRGHAQYCRLDDDALRRRLRECRGLRGPNRDYALNTLAALASRGIHDEALARLVADL